MDRPINLRKYSIWITQPDQEDSITVPVRLRQSSIDALHDILVFLEGYNAGSTQNKIDTYELIMFYRTICSCIVKAEEEAKKGLK